MKPFWPSMIVVCAVAGGGFYWWKTQSNVKAAGAVPDKTVQSEGKGADKRGGGPISVRTVTVTRQPMPVVIDAVGTVESEHSVVVRPQVNGVLQAVLFKEGDRVRQGQVLFRIDPRPAQAAVEQAHAALTRDQAQLAQARAQETRLRPLMEKDYITRQEYDVAATQAKALEATADANRAALEQARLQLSYSQIAAPISGRTGGLTVRAGNLVTAGNTSLVVINSTQPILVALSVPQRHLDDIRRYWNTPELKVEISPNPAAPAVAQGTLVFMDNTVNPTTGTILFKARVKNEKEELWPGQFIAARIILRIEKDAVVLPEGAMRPGQDGPFVYAVRDGKAAMQPIQIARQIGDLMVISKGLNGGEEVIADAPPTLTVDAPVQTRGADAGGGKGRGKGKKDNNPGEAGKESKESQSK